MHPLALISDDWQKLCPPLACIGAVCWLMLFRHAPTSEQAMFAALLVLYILHQTEEHFWPGGFRQFANAHVFASRKDNWPVDESGVAWVNIGYVWLPLLLAVIFPESLRWVGLCWIGLTFINALTHIIATARLHIYNPGLITSIVLFLPFTIWAFAHEHAYGLLSGAQIGWLLLAGILLHVPVAMLFVVPYWRARTAKAT